MPRLLYLITEDWYFRSHRLPLAVAAREAGYEVSVACRVLRHAREIESLGLRLLPLAHLRRGNLSPSGELRAVRELVALYRAERPDIVHHVAMKPVIYGSVAARVANVPYTINAITGLGYVFSSQTVRARALRPLTVAALRFALGRGKGTRVIVQNAQDREFFLEHGIVPETKISLIPGSGVDTERFAPRPQAEGVPVVVFPGRLLQDKGVEEFVAAARLLRARGVAARFVLVGDRDPENPASVPERTLQAWATEGIVEHWGWRDDMPAVYAEASVVCLPSWREGMPKALLEAASCGRAIVTCDVPGCRDVVAEGAGVSVPARDPQALAQALATLLADPARRRALGAQARARAVAEFSIERVVRDTLAIYAAGATAGSKG